MPIKKSAFKALRQSKKRTARRAARLKEVEIVVRKMRRLLAAKKKNEALALLKKIQKTLDKTAKKRIISKNRANRLKSKFSAVLAKM